ncbi:MAG: ABC transporter ATP-binding protein [Pseudomonadota bacterium]
MITLEGVHKSFRRGGVTTHIARGITARFPANQSVALLGRNGAGKSSLLKMIAGTLDPDRGRVRVAGSVSWPVGFAGSFHGDLTGAQTARFLARLYGVDTGAMVASVARFTELGDKLHHPVRTYSTGMKARLAFGASMAIPFDTYLVDEVTSVGDAAFKEKSKTVFLDRLSRSGAIVVSHTLPMLREICTAGAVLHDGTLTWHDDIETAIDHHSDLLRVEPAPRRAA